MCLCCLIRAKATDVFQPFQHGVASACGAERIVHQLRICIDDHWSDENFVLLKIDMSNAFNFVVHNTSLSCFLDLMVLWPASACTGDTFLRTGSTVGDPLGPFLLALVLCAHVLHHA